MQPYHLKRGKSKSQKVERVQNETLLSLKPAGTREILMVNTHSLATVSAFLISDRVSNLIVKCYKARVQVQIWGTAKT